MTNWIGKSLSDLRNTELFSFYFHDLTVEQIGDVSSLENLSKGIDVILNIEKIVTSVHLYSKGYQNADEFTGHIVYDFKLIDTRGDVRRKLGEPNAVGGGFGHDIFGYVEWWEKYFFDTYSLHFSYSKTDNLLLITIGSLELEKESLAD